MQISSAHHNLLHFKPLLLAHSKECLVLQMTYELTLLVTAHHIIKTYQMSKGDVN